jgi:hypothetical protein
MRKSYAEFKQQMALYDQIEAEDPIARIGVAKARSFGRVVVDLIGIAVMSGNYFNPEPGESRELFWLALAAVFFVLFVFDLRQVSRLQAAQSLLAEELWRIKETGAKDPLDMFNLLGGMDGWRQRVEAEAAEEAAIKRASKTDS